MEIKSRWLLMVGALVWTQGAAPSWADSSLDGGTTSGGGDAVVVDFVRAANVAYRWILENPDRMPVKVDSDKFLVTIDVGKTIATDDVLKDTDGNEVTCWFDAPAQTITINRVRWREIQDDPTKLKLAAHEIFRKMGVADDRYQVSRFIAESAYPMEYLNTIQDGVYKVLSLPGVYIPYYGQMACMNIELDRQRKLMSTVEPSEQQMKKYASECKSWITNRLFDCSINPRYCSAISNPPGGVFRVDLFKEAFSFSYIPSNSSVTYGFSYRARYIGP